MGGGKSKLPPFAERDRDILLSYNLEESHFRRLWTVFHEVDVDCNGFWTVNECFRLIREPRISMRAPIIDALFFFSDGKSDGCVTFQDFMVAFCSFCALSKEEVLQLFFMIVDEDRNGQIDKNELNRFFSFVPPEAQQKGAASAIPMFPVNNKNALDKFRGGKWLYLEFDGLAQLCERFPYIAYPVHHVQHLFRSKLLGLKFWQKLDDDRMKINMQERIFHVRAADGSWRPIERPGRCTMKEILEYSRRKTTVQNGKRVGKPAKVTSIISSEITKMRDEQISRMPLMNMIRNNRCMYYVPAKPPQDMRVAVTHKSGKQAFEQRPELELEGFDADRPMSAAEIVGGMNVPNVEEEVVEIEKPAVPDDDEWETDTDASDYEPDGGTGGGLPALPPPP